MIRHFSNKVRKIVENEFFTNPHFERAFPHLASKVKPGEVRAPSASWEDSLQHKYRPMSSKEHFATLEEDQSFVEGYRSPLGPLKWMSEEDKARVHGEAEAKMEELESTGLSREELLLNKPGGLPLSADPVFQHLKKHRLTREMLLKPGEEFTAAKIVDLALRQDIGHDRSLALGDLPKYFSHEIEEGYEHKVRAGYTEPKKITPEDYYWKEKLSDKLNMYKRYYGRALCPDYVPTREKLRQKHMRMVNMKDISPKNTEFLAQFMTDAGKIKNRWQTRLNDVAQRKVAKAIKHARNLNLFPFIGFILPPHKQSLKGIFSDDFNCKVLHAETGTMFARKYQDDASKTHQEIKFIDRQVKQFQTEVEDAGTLIKINDQFVPTAKQVQIIEALGFLEGKHQEGKDKCEELQEKLSQIEPQDIALKFVQEKAASEELEEIKVQDQDDMDIHELWKEIAEIKASSGLSPDQPEWLDEFNS